MCIVHFLSKVCRCVVCVCVVVEIFFSVFLNVKYMKDCGWWWVLSLFMCVCVCSSSVDGYELDY